MTRPIAAALLSLAVAACGGGSKPAPQVPDQAVVPTCADAARRGTAIITADAEVTPNADQQGRLEAALATSCTEDAWSADLIACIVNAPTGNDAGECEGMLTEPQQQGLEERVGPIMFELGEGSQVGSRRADEPAPPPPADMPTEAADPCEGGE